MKVAVSVFSNILEDNGTTVRARRVCDALREHFDVTLIAAKSGKGQRGHDQTTYISVPRARQSLQIPTWVLGLLRVMLRNKFDVVFYLNDWFGFSVLHILSATHKHEAIFEAHGILSDEYRFLGRSKMVVAFAQLLEKYVMKHASAVLALSQGIFNFYMNYNHNIELVPVFVDTERYRPDIQKHQELRQDYCVSGKLIGLIGPFNIKSNEHFLTFLHENISRFDSRIKFMVIGKCDHRIENERIIYTGYVEDYIDHLACLDCVLVPSRIATTGPLNKVLESMSLGLPVFTTPAGLVGLDYVTPGQDILVFEEKDLVNKIHESIFDEGFIEEIGKNARHTVEVYYSKEVNTKKLTKLFGVDSYVGY
ncbi:MAG: glycosyltransferase family 4 protein [Dehalococcoidia bacterium]